jgi:DNA-binding transcriptional regulator YhcF (GntR family)
VTILPLDTDAPEPPYDQLRTQVARRAAGGDLSPGTKLPTVRALATQLGLAANTVARAYRVLEQDGVVVTEGRRGTFVASSVAATSSEVLEAARAYAATARRLGLSPDEARKLLDDAW